MRRSFLSNLIFLLFLNFLVKPFWILGIDRSVQNIAGPEEYGIYFSLFNFTLLFQVLLDFGINNFNNRHIALKPERLGQYFFTALSAKFFFAVLYSIIVYLVAFGIQFDTQRIQILGLLILTQILISLLAFIRSNVSALHLFRADAILSVIDKLLTSGYCAIIIWTEITPWSMTIPLFIMIQIVGYLISSAIGLLILASQSVRWEFRINPRMIKGIIYKSMPFALLTFLMATYYRVDGVMLERMLGSDGPMQAGIYASAFRILDALNILGFLFGAVLLPSVAKIWGEKGNLNFIFKTSLFTMLTISIPIGGALLIYSSEIMDLLYTASTPFYGEVFGWLMAGFMIISSVYILGTILTGSGQLKVLNIIAVIGVVINVILNLILIPEQQALGAAKATVVTQILILILHIIASKKTLQLQLDANSWLRLGIYIITVSLTIYISTILEIQLGTALLLIITVSGLSALITGVISKKDLKPMLSEGVQ